MRVLCYIHAYVGHGREAGAETTMANLLEGLVERGWDVEVLLSQHTKPKVAPYILNGVKVSQETDPRELNDALRKADILISHLDCSERSALLANQLAKPMVHLVHNTMWQTAGYLAEGCDLAIYNSEWVAEHHSAQPRNAVTAVVKSGSSAAGVGRVDFTFRRQYEWPYVILHPQINPKDYCIEPSRPRPSGKAIGFVNFHENKNPAVFFEMARRFPDRKFLGLKGGYGEQDIPKELPPNVTIIENTMDIRRDFYGKCSIILVPSFYESFGRVALEAAASGIPCVASPTDGLLEALGHYALYADPEDYDLWADRLTELLSPDNHRVWSRLALARSNYWNEQRLTESDVVHEALTALVNQKG